MSATSSRANRQTRTEGASASGLVSAMWRASAASSAGQGDLVQADEQLLGRRRGEDLVEEDLQVRVGHDLQAQRRLAHLADAGAQGLDVLGAEVGVVRERGLQLVDRLGGDPGREDLVEPQEGVMQPLQPAHARLDAQARPRRLGDGGQAGQGRQAAIGPIGLEM